MKKSLFFLLLTASLSLFAEERTLEEMQTIARQRFQQTAPVKGNHAKARTIQGTVNCVSESRAYAIFEPESQDAYVIVSKSDCTAPIIGYAEGRFDTQQMPPALRWFLTGAEQSIMKAEAEGLLKADSHNPYGAVEPFMTTLWNQSSPYNDLVPNQYPAGCVAVAMAQCINYCKYPSRASFRGYCGYYPTSSSSRPVVDSLDINDIFFYPFLDGYGRATSSQKKSVAKLVRDCGYASMMIYSPSGSGTYNNYAGIALTYYFKYPEESIKYIQRDFADEETWFSAIYNNLHHKSPIIMGGSDEEYGGHAFVLCGMDEEGLVYVNWGWGGTNNGFYDLSLMNPADQSFCLNQDIICGIRKTPIAGDVRRPRIFSLSGEPYTYELKTMTDDSDKERQALHIIFPSTFENSTPTDLEGELGLFGTDLTTGESWQISETDPISFAASQYYELDKPTSMFYYFIDGELTPGHTYRISFGSRDKVENEWHSILCLGGEIAYDINYTGDIATTTISEVMNILPVSIQTPLADRKTQPTFRGYYDLSGRRYDDKPATRGVYIKDGQKVYVP